MSSSVDLFKDIPSDRSMKSGQMVGIRALYQESQGPFDFVITGDSASYIHLPSTRCYMRARVLVSDGTDIAATDEVGVVNNFGPSMIKSIDIQVNNTDLTAASNTNANYKSYLQNLYSYGETAADTFLQNSMWYRDLAGQMENMTVPPQPAAEDAAAPATNPGFLTRRHLIRESRAVDLYLPLACDFFCMERLLPNDTSLKIRLLRESDDFSLMYKSTMKSFKIEIDEIMLFVRKIDVSPSIVKQHQTLFGKGQLAKYNLPRTRIEIFPQTGGLQHIVLPNIFRGTVLPHHILLTIIKSSSFNGSAKENPYNLKHYNLNQCFLKVDGLSVPATPYAPDFSKECFAQEYASLFDENGIQLGPHTHHVTKTDYLNGYFSLCFDLSPDGCLNLHNHPGRSGQLEAEIRFKAAPNEAITILMMGSYDSYLMLDANRQPSIKENE